MKGKLATNNNLLIEQNIKLQNKVDELNKKILELEEREHKNHSSWLIDSNTKKTELKKITDALVVCQSEVQTISASLNEVVDNDRAFDDLVLGVQKSLERIMGVPLYSVELDSKGI